MTICKHCGEPANDGTHYFKTHDNHPYCCISDRKSEPRLVPGTPYEKAWIAAGKPLPAPNSGN